MKPSYCHITQLLLLTVDIFYNSIDWINVFHYQVPCSVEIQHTVPRMVTPLLEMLMISFLYDVFQLPSQAHWIKV